jgi:hypothetical protein
VVKTDTPAVLKARKGVVEGIDKAEPVLNLKEKEEEKVEEVQGGVTIKVRNEDAVEPEAAEVPEPVVPEKEEKPEKEPLSAVPAVGRTRIVISKRGLKRFLLGNRKKVLAGAAVFLLALAVASAWQGKAEGGKSGVGGLFAKDESEIMTSSFGAMQKVKSYAYEGKIRLYYKLKNDPAGSYSTDFLVKCRGVSDRTKAKEPASYANVAYDAYSNMNGVESETDLETETIVAGKNRYLKLNNFTVRGARTDGEAASLQELLKNSSNTWYAATPEEKKIFLSGPMRYFSLPTDLLSAQELGTGSAEDLEEIFSDSKLFTFLKNLGSENVGGTSTLHLRVELDSQEAFALAAKALERQAKEAGGNADLGSVLAELQENAREEGRLRQALDQLLDSMEFELWIGKEDNLVHRFRVSGSLDRRALGRLSDRLEEIYGGAYALKKDDIPDMEVGFELDYVLSGFGAGKVTEPTGAKNLSEVTAKLDATGKVLGSTATAPMDDADGDGLSAEIEQRYGTDATKADTDGDGYDDGTEINNGYDPLVPGSARLDYDKLRPVNKTNP